MLGLLLHAGLNSFKLASPERILFEHLLRLGKLLVFCADNTFKLFDLSLFLFKSLLQGLVLYSEELSLFADRLLLQSWLDCRSCPFGPCLSNLPLPILLNHLRQRIQGDEIPRKLRHLVHHLRRVLQLHFRSLRCRLQLILQNHDIPRPHCHFPMIHHLHQPRLPLFPQQILKNQSSGFGHHGIHHRVALIIH